MVPAVDTARFTIEVEQEQDGRWIAEVLELPGVMTYGESPENATVKVQALALRVVADRLEHDESSPPFINEDERGCSASYSEMDSRPCWRSATPWLRP